MMIIIIIEIILNDNEVDKADDDSLASGLTTSKLTLLTGANLSQVLPLLLLLILFVSGEKRHISGPANAHIKADAHAQDLPLKVPMLLLQLRPQSQTQPVLQFASAAFAGRLAEVTSVVSWSWPLSISERFRARASQAKLYKRKDDPER